MRIEVNQKDLSMLAAQFVVDRLGLDRSTYRFRVEIELDTSKPAEEMVSAYVTLIKK